MHALLVKLLRLIQLQSQIKQAQRRDHAQAQRYTPDSTQMVFREDQHQDHSHQSRDDVGKIDLKIAEHDEPSIPVATLQLICILGGGNRSGGILATDSDAQKEPIRSQGRKHAVRATMQSIGARTQGAEDDQDNCGNHERPLARPVIAQVSEDQLSKHRAGEGDGRDVLASGGVFVGVGVDLTEDSVDWTDDLRRSVIIANQR